jgi:hypothetical protein
MFSYNENITKFQQDPNNSKFREYLLSRNKFLSIEVWKNAKILQEMQKIYENLTKQSNVSTITDSPNVDTIAEITETSSTYNSKLKMSKNFPVSLCKSKYFKFTVKLELDPEIIISRDDKVRITVKLFTYDSKPVEVIYTMQGKNILRGNFHSTLAYDIVEEKHLAHFKLQIKEVSSHYVGGLFSLVLEPEQSLESKGIHIQPLVINNIKVKAKERSS